MIWPIIFVVGSFALFTGLFSGSPTVPSTPGGFGFMLFSSFVSGAMGYWLGRILGGCFPYRWERLREKTLTPHPSRPEFFLVKCSVNANADWVVIYHWYDENGELMDANMPCGFDYDITFVPNSQSATLAYYRRKFSWSLAAIVGILPKSRHYEFFVPEGAYIDETGADKYPYD